MPSDFDEVAEAFRAAYPPVVGTRTAAEILATTPEVVRELVRSGRLPAYRWGRSLKFFTNELIAWVREHAETD